MSGVMKMYSERKPDLYPERHETIDKIEVVETVPTHCVH